MGRFVLGGGCSDFKEDNVPFRVGMTGALLTDTKPKTMLSIMLAICQE